MKPVICAVNHKPPHSYGDCVRACVASLLHMETEEVPHFYHDGDGAAGHDRMRKYLATEHRKFPAYYALGAEMTVDDVCRAVVDDYGSVEFMLWCGTDDGGDHAVIGQNGRIIHDPAWFRTDKYTPHSSGVWIVILLLKVE